VATWEPFAGRRDEGICESQSVPDKIEAIEAMLSRLARERDALEAEIETMIGDMAAAPADERRSGAWAEHGAATARYLELSERLAAVEQAIIDLTRRRAAPGPPPSAH
jgi:hypothetical protein